MVDPDADPIVVDTDVVGMDIDAVDMGIDAVDMDIDDVDMDIDLIAEDYGQYMGVEDYGRLISSISCEVLLSKFCSSKYMTPACDQNFLDSCVSCTLSAALSALAGLTYDRHIAPEFSTQEMVDCLPIKCGGVKYELGYDYVMQKGLHLVDDYPYLCTYDSPCRCPALRGRPKGSFEHYFCFPPEIVPEVLWSHPLTAGIHCFKSFAKYRTPYVSANDLMGIYSPLVGEEPLQHKGKICDHAVLVIGHGFENNESFFIVKNWSSVSWGVNGYARVACDLLFGFAFPSGFRELFG